MNSKCNLIVDSCCDLPADLIARPGVELLGFPYFASDGEHIDDLFQSQAPQAFYESIRKGEKPSTAQIPLPVLHDTFERAMASGVPTVYLSFSSGLTGCFDTACSVCEQLREQYPDAEFYLVDTQLASIAEGLLVYEALRQRAKGLTASELARWAQEALNYVGAIFMVDDLSCLRRGGRIPEAVAMLGTKLNVKPLLSFSLDGRLSLVGLARGRKKAIKQMVDYYEAHQSESGGDRIAIIADADCKRDLARLHEAMEKADDSLSFIETNVGPVIGSHVGPEMLAMVFWSKDRRNELSIADRIARKIKNDDEVVS